MYRIGCYQIKFYVYFCLFLIYTIAPGQKGTSISKITLWRIWFWKVLMGWIRPKSGGFAFFIVYIVQWWFFPIHCALYDDTTQSSACEEKDGKRVKEAKYVGERRLQLQLEETSSRPKRSSSSSPLSPSSSSPSPLSDPIIHLHLHLFWPQINILFRERRQRSYGRDQVSIFKC